MDFEKKVLKNFGNTSVRLFDLPNCLKFIFPEGLPMKIKYRGEERQSSSNFEEIILFLQSPNKWEDPVNIITTFAYNSYRESDKYVVHVSFSVVDCESDDNCLFGTFIDIFDESLLNLFALEKELCLNPFFQKNVQLILDCITVQDTQQWVIDWKNKRRISIEKYKNLCSFKPFQIANTRHHELIGQLPRELLGMIEEYL